jgi:hypothetical protein
MSVTRWRETQQGRSPLQTKEITGGSTSLGQRQKQRGRLDFLDA